MEFDVPQEVLTSPNFFVLLERLAPFLSAAEAGILTAGALFVRISMIVFFLPGFGERLMSIRVKLGVALAFAVIVWPMVSAQFPAWTETFSRNGAELGAVYLAEAVNGALLGLMVRLFIFALQIAGALAAQSLSISQMFGAGVAPDPEPTIATMLTLGGITLAFVLGLHVKAAALIVDSYSVLSLGAFPIPGDAAAITVERVGATFRLAVSLALPFVLVSFMYNLALGFINKAMPQLMVALVGLPAITWIGIVLLTFTAVGVLAHWHTHFDRVLLSPLGV